MRLGAKGWRLAVAVMGFGALALAPVLAAQPRSVRVIARDSLADKIRGGWAGQMIGVAYGAPTEFRAKGRIIDENIGNYRDWTPQRITNALEQDDLYVEMTFAEVMDRDGIDASTAQYGAMFAASRYPLWHGNAAARRLLAQGVPAGRSGDPRFNGHSNDIDFQIESDFIGLMAPGLPASANRIADRVGRVMARGDGLYGGMFFAGMYSAAFFERDPRRVVEAGLGSIPADSGYAQVVRDVLRWHDAHPDDWRATWQLIEAKWDRDDPCPEGAGDAFNIDARLNGAYVVLGLLYGAGDFAQTMEVATRAGQDSDCNPSSAAGILGVMLGYDAIPEKWKAGLPAIADSRFQFTGYSFNSIVESTLRRAMLLVSRAGGRIDGANLLIPLQNPVPPKLEQARIGRESAVIGAGQPGWQIAGGFAAREDAQGNVYAIEAVTSGSARIAFSGSAVALIGPADPAGGLAEVWLDGRRLGQFDAWRPADTYDQLLWFGRGLKPGPHSIEIRAAGRGSPRSRGTRIAIGRLVSYDGD